MSTTEKKKLSQIPISQRPKRSISSRLKGLAFFVLFNCCCLSVHLCQWILLPLRILSQSWCDASVRYSKYCFAVSLIWMTQLFAPTEFIVTTEGSYFEREGIVEKDASGFTTKINLPSKLVIISNHQVYLDWWYLWSFTYWTGNHKDVIIVLKKSLKWIPIIGWGMIWFRFIFLNRNWATDSKYYIRKLTALAERTVVEKERLSLFIFPEGTLVSKDTRPLSKKWATKCGIPDLQHALLPRTTGLHYALRALSPRIPDLHLLDVTVAYEGIPRGAYGQSYFTLRSVFMDGVPPPKIHLHLKLFHVGKDIPIGAIENEPENSSPLGKVETDISRVDSTRFENWLLNLWQRKDDLFEHFYDRGNFSSQDSQHPLRIQIRLRKIMEIVHSCGIIWVWWIIKVLWGYI